MSEPQKPDGAMDVDPENPSGVEQQIEKLVMSWTPPVNEDCKPVDAEEIIKQLVDQFVDDLGAGRCPDRRSVVAAHPDIADALECRLELVETMFGLGLDAEEPQSPVGERLKPPEIIPGEHSAPARRDSEEPAAQRSPFNAGQAIRVKCPHCGNRVQLIEPDPQEVTCMNCGSSFQVTPDATLTHRPAALPDRIGKFEVLGLLGGGAFGTVYKAHDPELDVTVAVKVPRAGYFETEEEKERFLREARSAARLKHGGIVQVHEIGHERGMPYIVSDYVAGITLADRLTGDRPSFRESAELVAQIADALDYAHREKVIHRDIKPSNILIDNAARPHLTDFGLARRDEGEITVTLDGQILGTPAYMSPEQAAGDQSKVDARSDVYSLGGVLYELLTGELPFRGNKRMLLHQVLHDDPRSPRSLNDAIPRDLETICLKAMAKSAARRYHSARELADELRRWLNGEPVHARPVGRAERLARWCSRNPLVASLTVATAVLLIAVTAGSVFTAVRESSLRADAEKERGAVRRHLYIANMNLAQKAWEEARVGRVLELLKQPKRRPGEEDLRGFEWYYWRRLCHSNLLDLTGDTCGVVSVAFSPDGQRLASSGFGGTVKVWDAVNGNELLTLKGRMGKVSNVAFSPNGMRLASAIDDQTVKVWDAATGRELLALKGHTGQIKSVAFSPDGLRLASGSGDLGGPAEIKVWDAVTGRDSLTIKVRSGPIECLTYSPDGKRLASASPNPLTAGVKVWDAITDEELLTLKTSLVESVAFSPDGQRLASASLDNTVKVWDAATGQQLLTLKGHTNWVKSVAFSPDGKRLASASHDQTVKVWDAAKGNELHTLKGHTSSVYSLAFRPDGKRLASASSDGTVKVWDAAADQESLTLKGYTPKVTSVAFSPDSQRLASASEALFFNPAGVKVWDAATGKESLTMKGHPHYVTSVAFSSDGKRLASASHDQTVKVWDAATGQESTTLKGHTARVMSVAFSPDGKRLASASQDKTVKLWDASTGQELLTLKGRAPLKSLAFSPDGKRLASTSYEHTVTVWDATTGQELLTLKGHTHWVESVAFSSDGQRLASASHDQTVKVWDTTTGTELLTLKGHTDAVLSVAFGPDGKRLASASDDKSIKLWDATTGQELLTLKGHAGGVTSVAFSPDGQQLASGSGGGPLGSGEIKLWDAMRTGVRQR